MKKGLVYIQRELRLHDNPLLRIASESCELCLPIFILDSSHLHNNKLGFPRISQERLRFLYESLVDLNDSLKRIGGHIQVETGDPLPILSKILLEDSYTDFFIYRLPGVEEEKLFDQLQSFCNTNGIQFHYTMTHSLIDGRDLSFDLRNIPFVYTEFRKKIESKPIVREPESRVSKIFSPPPKDWIFPELKNSKSKLNGGESKGMERLTKYFWISKNVSQYKNTRNQLLGEDYSTLFSPYLAWGCLSPRWIYAQLKEWENQNTANESSYWVWFELLWRDFFQFHLILNKSKFFLKTGILERDIPAKQDKELFEKWRLGNTGQKFVDANMRELFHTGFMSNRGRQNVASFLVHDMQLDWRWGAFWFESKLIDYDPASNYGNWNYIAGIGHDPRFRKFNIEKQQEMYDPKSEFIKFWEDKPCI
jgi:deoxyribodipyrimidine photo-lyase